MVKKIIVIIICLYTFSSCKNVTLQNSENEKSVPTNVETYVESSVYLKSLENTTVNYDYTNLGIEKGLYFSEIGKKYFHTSLVGYIDKSREQFIDIGTDRHYCPILGLINGRDKNDKITYEEMNYEELKAFFFKMGISEHAFKSFQKNSCGAYYDIDGQLYSGIIDSGLGGWNYSYIDSYNVYDENTVQYNCILTDYSIKYEDDLENHEKIKTEPFTFTLKKENGNWQLYDCSNTYAFFEYFVGVKSNYVKE